MLIQETHINRTEGYMLGEAEPYEPFTEDTGKLFRELQREYGRCISKAYVDPDGKQIGWVFQKLTKYQDSNETYLAETWITVYEKWEKQTVVDCEYYQFS